MATETERDQALEFANRILEGKCKSLEVPAKSVAEMTRAPAMAKFPFWIPTDPENLSHYILDAKKVIEFAGDEVNGLGLNACGIDSLIGALIAVTNERNTNKQN